MRWLLLVLICSGLSAQTPEKWSRVRISLDGKNLAALASLGLDADHGKIVPGRYFETEISLSDLETVKTAGFETEILVPDLQAWYLAACAKDRVAEARTEYCEGWSSGSPPFPTPVNYTYGSMGGFHTYDELLGVLDDMAAKFPHLISLKKTISDSVLTHEGRPVWHVRISDHPGVEENEPKVLYTGLHHAREPASASQMLFFMWYLLENYDSNALVKYIVDGLDLYFIPCLNPDGYIYNCENSPQGGGQWRKNRRDNGNGRFGVDLNRNYGYQWGIDNTGSSPNPLSDTYRGPAPFSEPETRMLRDFMSANDFRLALNYHSYGNLFIIPWGYSNELADPQFVEYAKLLTKDNLYYFGTGYQLLGYEVNGVSDDWMYAVAGTVSFTPEVGAGTFWPLPSQIDGVNRANCGQNLRLALCALQYFEAADFTAKAIQKDFDILLSVKRFGMEEGPAVCTIKSLTNKATINASSKEVSLAPFQSEIAGFPGTVFSGTKIGDTLYFELRIQYGGYAEIDTLLKVYLEESMPSIAFQDDFTGPGAWSGNWGPDASQYVSPPTSLADSPGGEYGFGFRTLKLNSPVVLPKGAGRPRLQFHARWDIEENVDYLQVKGYGSNGIIAPLCGRYTQNGAGFLQPFGEPVYDGIQAEWVEEEMDLSEFAGTDLTIEFRLAGDEFAGNDGFYLDDLRVIYADSVSGTEVIIPQDQIILEQNSPNPLTESTRIAWQNPEGVPAILKIINAAGRIVWENSLPENLREGVFTLSAGQLSEGIYYYYIETSIQKSTPKKLCVTHR